MTLSKIIQINSGLQKLGDKSFDGKTSFAILRANRAITPIMEDYEKVRGQIVTANLPEGETAIDPAKHPEAFAKVKTEIESLFAREEDISLPKLSMDALTKAEVSISVLDALFPIIEES